VNNNNTIKDTINYQEDININNINKKIYFYNKIKNIKKIFNSTPYRFFYMNNNKHLFFLRLIL
jgi:hypothetical protein